MENRPCVGAEGMWEISTCFAQFCYEPKIPLKVLIKKREEKERKNKSHKSSQSGGPEIPVC